MIVMKRILKIAVFIMGAFLMLLIAALIFFSSSPGESIIRNRIEETLKVQLELTVTIGKFETNLFSRIQLYETVVGSPVSSGSDSLIYIEKTKVTYSIFDLLSGDFNLESAIIENVNINISVDSLGNYGIPALDTARKVATDEREASISVSIEQVVLDGVNAVYDDKRLPVNISLYNLSSRIMGNEYNEYTGNISADSILTLYENQPLSIRRLNCDFQWDKRNLSVASAAEIEKLDLNARASFRIPELDSLSLKASLEGDPSDIAEILKNKFGLPQVEMNSIAINASAEGSFESPEIAVEILSPRSRIEDIELGSLRLYTGYSSDVISIRSAIINLLGGKIIAQGSVSLGEAKEAAANLRIEDLNLSRLLPVIYKNESPCTGKLKGSVRANGRIDAISGWYINGGLDVSDLQYHGRPAADLGLEFSALHDSAQLTLTHAKDTVRTVAVLKNGNIKGDFYANIPEISAISRFADMPDLKGNISAEGSFEGSLDNPLVKISMKGDKISYKNFPVDKLTADLHYRDSSLIINYIRFSGSRPDSAKYQSILGLDSLYGVFEYDCNMRGSSDYLEGDISAKINSIEYSGYEVDSAYAFASMSGSKVELDSLTIYIRDLIVKSSGSYDTSSARGILKTNIFSFIAGGDYLEGGSPGGDIEITDRGMITTEFALRGKDDFKFDLECDSVWPGLLKSFTEIDTPENGFINLELSFEGNTVESVGSLSASAYSIVHPSYEIDSIVVTADIVGEYLHLSEFRLFAYGKSVSASSEIYLDRDQDGNLLFSDETAISGEMTMGDLDLSVLQPFLTPKGVLSGKASADFTWDGTKKNPGLEGRVSISSGYFKYVGVSNALENLHLQLNLNDSLFTIDSASCYSAGTPLSVKGSVRYKFPEEYEVSASLSVYDKALLSTTGKILEDSLDLKILSDNFDLNILEPFIAVVDSLGGRLNSEAFIGGRMASPQITGFVEVSDFSLFSRELSSAVRSGLLNARFDKTRIDIDSLYADINGGPMSLSGYLVHDAGALADINLNLKASNISYKKAGIFEGELQFADLKYGRKEDQYFLDGDVSLGESRLTAKFPLNSILPWARSVETVEYEFPDIIARTRLNVRFRENDDLWIDNNLANIRMKAELGIIGTPAKPIPSGPVSIEEGYFIYLDRRFKVEEGKLFFSDPLKMNPEIILHAKTQITTYQRTVAEKYEVHIKIEGDLENPVPYLYSEPPLDKSDIIALLTFGKTRSQLAGGSENQGGIKNVLVERASRLTSNRISGYISDKVGSMFGFDEFTVEGNLFRLDNSWGPRLVASRRISRRVQLTYSTTVGHLNDQGVRLGYHLTSRISIQGETDQAGRSGIDFRYGLKFR